MSSEPHPIIWQLLGFSQYAKHQFQTDPALALRISSRIKHPITPEEIHNTIQAIFKQEDKSAKALGALLRAWRREVFLTLMARDVGGWASLNEVIETMSCLAEESIRVTSIILARELSQSFGIPMGEQSGKVQELHVIGLGKLGGRELNVSSDVDLVFLYPEEGETQGGTRTLTNQEYFHRLGQQLVQLLSESTVEGWVFRVDMRLRPWGDGPLAMSFDALENYFVSHGRDWERYAWIKARVLVGTEGKVLMSLVTPFVYRRYLDIDAILALRELHAQVQQEVLRRDLEHHLKLGSGGIREIEFVVQMFQLIRGGRIPGLRGPNTLTILKEEVQQGLVPAEEAEALTSAYQFLRRMEHAVQYIEDAQTHLVPQDPALREGIGRAMGFPNWDTAATQLATHRNAVAKYFNTALGESPSPTLEHSNTIEEQINARGFADKETVCRYVNETLSSSRARQLGPKGRTRLEKLVQVLIQSAAQTAVPDESLKRLLVLAETLSSRTNYMSLLIESPEVCARLATLCATSEWAAQHLTRHPVLLDELIDTRTLYAPPDVKQYQDDLKRRLEQVAEDLEEQMNQAREMCQAAVFRILAQDLQGLLTVERIADYLSAIADATLQVVLQACWNNITNNRERAEPRFCIIAYGKLGGKELGYASDLDLVFLFDETDQQFEELYARLAQKLTLFLETRTTAGRLYEIDTRLRPDGVSGLPVAAFSMFCDYQRHRAWLWEHQALTRARYCAGNAEMGARFEQERRHLLSLPRVVGEVQEGIRTMRHKMMDAHPNRGDPKTQFDLKHDPGGMVDIEFCVQALVLCHAHRFADLLDNKGNIALLDIAAQHSLIDAHLAKTAGDTYREWRRQQHLLRLSGNAISLAPRTACEAGIAIATQLWNTVIGER